MNKDVLSKVGIDYDECLKHFMGDEAFYKEVLETFVNSNVLERSRVAFKQGDKQDFEDLIHQAKGESGVARIDIIFQKASSIMRQIKSGNCEYSEISDSFEEFSETYSKVKETIKLALHGF